MWATARRPGLRTDERVVLKGNAANTPPLLHSDQLYGPGDLGGGGGGGVADLAVARICVHFPLGPGTTCP